VPKYCKILTLYFILLQFASNVQADNSAAAFSIQLPPSLVNHYSDTNFLEVDLNFLEIFFMHSNYLKIRRAIIFDIWSSFMDLNAVNMATSMMSLTMLLVIFGMI
jgi:hypothetical protein